MVNRYRLNCGLAAVCQIIFSTVSHQRKQNEWKIDKVTARRRMIDETKALCDLRHSHTDNSNRGQIINVLFSFTLYSYFFPFFQTLCEHDWPVVVLLSKKKYAFVVSVH
jgi:hypothetical protein